MKIGILTYPFGSNYGGILQNFALQQVLKSMGHEVYTIDWYDNNGYPSLHKHIIRWLGRCFKRFIMGQSVTTAWNPVIPEDSFLQISRHLKSFISDNITTTRKVHVSSLHEIDEKYGFDVYIVGSDQVWNLNCSPTSFLPFVKRNNVKKIVYAASAGKTLWIKDDRMQEECRNLITSFNAVSVREYNLIDVCERYLSVTPSFVLDPTMLLNIEDFKTIMAPPSPKTSAFIFAYWLDKSETKNEIANVASKLFQLNLINGGPAEQYVKGKHEIIEECLIPSISNWLENISEADLIITDSFHGVVFSIIFHKQFIALVNKERGAERFYSLLQQFHLESRIVHEAYEIDNFVHTLIDYTEVESILQQLKQRSSQFLKTALDS